jgi:lipoprotein-anchoring transpeptidase ErfK/SrfK
MKLSYYEKGKKIGTMDVSTGDETHPTPLGRFKISTKSKLMLSKSA